MKLPPDWCFQILGILIGCALAVYANSGHHVALKNYPSAIQTHGEP